MQRLRDMPGLGPKSEDWLIQIGINTPEELRNIGAVRAFFRLSKESDTQPSLNLLYAMVGALEGESWLKIAKHEKSRLLSELEGYRELEELFQAEGIKLPPP